MSIKLRNRTMAKMLSGGKCVDVREIGIMDPANVNHFLLSEFIPGVRYCDSVNEQWIYSIGRYRDTGAIIASVQADICGHPDFESVFS